LNVFTDAIKNNCPKQSQKDLAKWMEENSYNITECNTLMNSFVYLKPKMRPKFMPPAVCYIQQFDGLIVDNPMSVAENYEQLWGILH